MKIKLKLFANLKKFLPYEPKEGFCEIEIQDNATVKDVLDRFNIPSEYSKIILINGIHKRLDDKLKEGDTLSVFPPLAGG